MSASLQESINQKHDLYYVKRISFFHLNSILPNKIQSKCAFKENFLAAEAMICSIWISLFLCLIFSTIYFLSILVFSTENNQVWIENVRKCISEKHPAAIEVDILYKLKSQVIWFSIYFEIAISGFCQCLRFLIFCSLIL